MEFTFEDPMQEQIQPMINQPQIQPQKQPLQFTFEDAEPESYFNPEMPKKESWGQFAQRVPVGLASTAAKSVGKVADLFENIQKSVTGFGLPEEEQQELRENYKRSPFSQFISEENIERGLNKIFPKEYRDPKDTFFEKTIHRAAGDFPFIAAAIASAGTSALPTIAAKSGASALGSQGAESAGFGPFVQALAGIGSSLGVDTVKKMFKGGFIQDFAKDIQKDSYAKSEPIAKTIVTNGKPAEEELLRLRESAYSGASGMEKTAQKAVQEQLDNAINIISEGKVNLQDAIDQKKHFNKIIKGLPYNDQKISYYKRAVGAFNKVIERVEKAIPSFGEPYRIGEDISEVIGTIDKTRHAIEAAKIDPKILSQPLRQLLNKPFWLIKNAIPSDLAHYAIKSPKVFTKYMGNIVNSAVNGDPATLHRNIMNMNKFINQTDKKKRRRV